MSLSLDFRSASGRELSLLSTPDSQTLGSRPVLTNEFPTPPVPSLDELLPVPPSPRQPSPPSAKPPIEVDRPGRYYLPPAMTDLKLAMDYFSMPITPFRYFVAPEIISSPGLFPQFMDLPPEIHRIIFRFCDTPTLFHLIHTSSYTRQECLGLFWQFCDENTWYRLEKCSEAFDGEHPRIYDCPDFASRVTQVEITLPFHWFGMKREFWRRFQDIFPSAQRVAFYEPHFEPSLFHAMINQPLGSETSALDTIAELMAQVPPNITALLATSYGGKESGMRSRLWRIQGSELSQVLDPWTPMRVVLPPKQIRPGILNHFLISERLGTEAIREMYGTDWLKWETYLRYPDASGIECPHPGCDDNFPNETDWNQHLLLDHDERDLKNAFNQSILTYCRNTPPDVKAILDEKQRRLDEANFIRSIMVEELMQWYQENGDQGRRQFEDTLAQQLKEYGFLTYAESLSRWELFSDYVSAWLNDWGDEPGDHGNYDYDNYEVESDEEYPEDEISDYDYAGEEYFVYAD